MQNYNLILTLTAQLALMIVFVWLSLYILVKILRLAVRWIRWTAKQQSTNTTINLICFAVAAYFFPRPLIFILSRGWDIIFAVATDPPIALQQQFPPFEYACRSTTPTELCLTRIGISLWASWNVFLANLFPRVDLNHFPLIDAILLTAIWLALANVLNWAN